MDNENLRQIESLQALKINNHYQYLCEKLKSIKKVIDDKIFDEETDNSERERLIYRSNTIKLFLELPDDLIEELTPQEES